MQPDPEHTRHEAFDNKEGYSGEDYHRRDEAIEGAKMPAGTVGTVDKTDTSPGNVGEAGRRAHFDPKTGEVHGSGAGTGGGNPGENLDSDED